MSRVDDLSPASVADVVGHFEARGDAARVDRSGRVFYWLGGRGPEFEALPLEAWAIDRAGRIVPPSF